MESKPAHFPLESRHLLRQMLDGYYDDVRHAAANGVKTVYAIGHAPTDLAVAMGYLPVYPENHATMCAVANSSTFHCETAEEHRYSPDLCSYAKNDLGSFFAGTRTKSPVGGLPKPDLLMATSMCNTHVKWFEELSRIWNVPLLNLDVPYVHDGLSQADVARRVEYAKRQLREQWIPFFEQHCGRRYNWDKLEEVVANTARAGKLWEYIVKMNRNIPAPLTAFDIFVNLGALMTLRGWPQAVSYYEALQAEVAARVKAGFSAIGEERYRLYWDNIPVWFKLGYLARKFASYNACLTVAVYPFTWIDVFANQDPARPVDSIAEAQCLLFLNKGTRSRVDFLRRLVEEYRIDGLVTQIGRTCKMFLPDQLGIIKMMQAKTGLPVLVFEGDMVDARFFSEAKVESALETFMGRLAQTKQ